MVAWDAAFEADPANTKDQGLGAGDIRTLKQEIRARLDREHEMQNATDTNDGLHRCDTTSKKFIVRDSTLTTDILTIDETAKTAKLATDYEFQNSDGRDVNKRYREIIWSVPGTVVIGNSGIPYAYLPMESSETATIKSMKLLAGTAPTGDSITVELKKWSSTQDPTDTPTSIGSIGIAAGSFKGSGSLTGTVAEDEYLQPTVTNKGSTVSGSDLSIVLVLEY